MGGVKTNLSYFRSVMSEYQKYQKQYVRLMNEYPAIQDLKKRAISKIPRVASEYLETGTDDETAIKNNIRDLSRVRFKPEFLKGELDVELGTTLLGHKYSAPFGIAPVGLTGLMWPKIEQMLARAAKDMNIPFSLSTVATDTPENISPLLSPSSGWFQLYVPPDMPTTMDILKRASDAGFKQLLITVDIPQASRRQRSRRSGLTMPPKMNAQLIWDGITHPHWLMDTLKNGLPRLRTVEKYDTFNMTVEAFKEKQKGSNLSWEYAQKIKDAWEGPVILKGIMSSDDALKAIDTGFDGIVVSNHGGRQFDAAPSSIYVLPEIASAVKGQIPIIFDGGIRTGLDIIRAVALGADFTLVGRAFIYSVCALQQHGPYHAYKILFEEMENNMRQLGIENLQQVRNLKAIIENQ